VILPFSGYPFRKAAEILSATDPKFAVDLIARTPEQIEQRLAIGDDFVQEIVEQGKVLHESTHAGKGTKATPFSFTARSRRPDSYWGLRYVSLAPV
jgi:hypothetical protein